MSLDGLEQSSKHITVAPRPDRQVVDEDGRDIRDDLWHPPGPLMSLPRELRDMIYEAALVSAEPVYIDSSYGGHFSRQSSRNHNGRTVSIPTALLRVSRQIYAEAAPIVWRDNELAFDNYATFTMFMNRYHHDEDGNGEDNSDSEDNNDVEDNNDGEDNDGEEKNDSEGHEGENHNDGDVYNEEDYYDDDDGEDYDDEDGTSPSPSSVSGSGSLVGHRAAFLLQEPLSYVQHIRIVNQFQTSWHCPAWDFAAADDGAVHGDAFPYPVDVVEDPSAGRWAWYHFARCCSKGIKSITLDARDCNGVQIITSIIDDMRLQFAGPGGAFRRLVREMGRQGEGDRVVDALIHVTEVATQVENWFHFPLLLPVSERISRERLERAVRQAMNDGLRDE